LFNLSSLLEHIATFAPAELSTFATPFPIPELPASTTATLPLRSIFKFNSLQKVLYQPAYQPVHL